MNLCQQARLLDSLISHKYVCYFSSMNKQMPKAELQGVLAFSF